MRVTFFLKGLPDFESQHLRYACECAAVLASRGHWVTMAFMCDLLRSRFINKNIIARWHTFVRRRSLVELFPDIPHLFRVRLRLVITEHALPLADVIVITDPSLAPVLDTLSPIHGTKIMLLREGEIPPKEIGAVPLLCFGADFPPSGFDEFRFRHVKNGPKDAVAFERALLPFADPGAADSWFRAIRQPAEPSFRAPFRILLITTDTQACCQVRLLNALKRLEANRELQVRVRISSSYSRPSVADLHWSNLVILQRVADPSFIALINRAKSLGIPVFFEIDDLLLDIPESHPAASLGHRTRNLKRVINACDRVIISTTALAEAMMQQGITVPLTVLPNYVDSDLFTVKFQETMGRKKQTVVIGYAGSTTHAVDFNSCAEALAQLLRERGQQVRLEFMGYMPEPFVGSSNACRREGSVSYHHFARLLAGSQWDFALAPIASTHFNQCKSRIKYLEYSCCGIPGVYSNWGPYSRFVTHGSTGILVDHDTPENWYRAILALVDNPDLRMRIAEKCQRDVCDNFQITTNLDTYRNILLCSCYASTKKN